MDKRETNIMIKSTRTELYIFILYLASVFAAEVLILFYVPIYSLVFHSAILVFLLGLSAVHHTRKPASYLYRSLTLASLIRILSLSLPLHYFPRFSWYLIASLPVLIAAYMLLRALNLNLSSIGFTLNKPLTQAGIALTGILFGAIEYLILQPESLATNFAILESLILAIVLILSTGFVEELVFRGILQNAALTVFTERVSVLGISIIFAILHIGWLSLLDVIFVFIIGLFFSYVVLKTKSIIGVSLSHGITNVFLFIVMPSLGSLIV
jgi:membrane protease YdiL (CAAX protease family)